MRHILLAASLILAACATAAAQTPSPAAPAAEVSAASPIASSLPVESGVSLNPADAPAGAYELDSRHVSVIWRVRHTGLGVLVGRFENVSGTLQFDPSDPTKSSFEATINAASVSSALPDAADKARFDHQIAQVLGADDHPDISFHSNAVTLTGPASGLISGDLTLNGQTHPATFEVAFHGGKFVQLRGKHVLAFAARTIIDRKQWSVENFVFNRFAGEDVEILIEAEFVKS